MTTVAHELARTRRFLTVEDVDDIQTLVRMLPERPVKIIDLGAGSGTTALALFCARSYGITVWTCDVDEQALHWARANLEGNGYLGAASWFAIHKPAHELAHQWAASWPATVDLLLHDADHSEEAVRRDLAAWLPLMRPGGLVWVHDFKPMPGAEEAYPGVAAAVAELDLEPLPLTGIGWAGRVR